jgi:iron(III) transport system substrate-binding protein
MRKYLALLALGCGAAVGMAAPAESADGTVKVHAGRFNERIAAAFSERTGIAVEIVKGSLDEIAPAILQDGQKAVDVLVGGDLAGLQRLLERGLFEPVRSETIETRVPAQFREPDGHWFGTFKRGRVIYYNPDLLPTPPRNYADLADPAYRGKVCVGSGASGYNLSFISSLIGRVGPEATAEFVRDYVANDAGAPKGHDPVQILNVGSGQCAATIANHYYFLNLKAEDKPENRDALAKVKLVWPDQEGSGMVADNGGAGLAKNAANREGAIAFLEFLVSDEGQELLAGRAFFPVVGTKPAAAVAELGTPVWSTQNAAEAVSRLTEAKALVEAANWPSPPPRKSP